MVESATFHIRLNVLKSVASIISLGRLFQQSTDLFEKMLFSELFWYTCFCTYLQFVATGFVCYWQNLEKLRTVQVY